MLEKEELKKLAGEKAVEQVEDNMIIGLGTGSTIKYSIIKLGELVRNGLKIKAVPTSVHTQRLAKEYNIPLTTLEENSVIDLTIDGADEVDSDLNLIKGGGGALTREKIIAFNSKKVIIVIDDSKIVKALGIDFALPVEVLRFGWTSTKRALEEFGCNVELRKVMGDEPFITDNSNYILDCDFDRIENPEQLERDINNIPGVVENGLFVGLVDEVIVGGKQGILTLCKQSVV
ncbi:MAG: ribose-5-phosphate isomerase RpiA [Candidatus Thermoplasmatota archaeon]|nr:ribose-5-phosphate isomerase RpiA [Candidatus Thermoplasmatota archaeon]